MGSTPTSHLTSASPKINSVQQEYLDKIQALDLSDLVVHTGLTHLPHLSERLACDIRLKREDQQSVFSFKIRGAYAKLQSLTDSERKKGVICASAGNHAQGVAVAAKHLGISAVVVMPIITPDIKVEAVRAKGADVVLYGENFDQACEHAYDLAEQQQRVFVHPYDDEVVIQGQATIGLEILQQLPHTDYVYVPIGGGGMAAGIALAIKALKPECKVIGVEAAESASMHAAFAAGKPVALGSVGRFAEGVAVKQVGELTYQLCKQFVDDIIQVSNDEICAATQDTFEDARVIPEPAGAIALAGIKKHLPTLDTKPQFVVGILCGANVNFNRLRYIAERADLGEQKEAILAVTIPERPGSFLQFCEVIGERSITEFNYRYNDESEAHVFVGVALKQGAVEKMQLINALEKAGYAPVDLSADETAKSHVRYMVGGRAKQALHEKLYRFSFPEQPGALLGFLKKMASNWNISLFHYRNHGSDYGRVLLGIQVPDNDALAFTRFLNATGFSYVNESENPAYKLFL
ncbi:MAG: threonine ammonia-lyase, biosynthetic [Gammaproteobacteria bacterium]|nr:threonine ammonia-lyase, biosynthetic [Gammaproteobacteria bacterium]NNM12885.1 threonine ammonia-lyase, biosynthetic [Gammaproteobacteria bacterium]